MSGELSKNNKGFSLVELIVTVLIVGIISGTAVVSIASIYGAKVDSAAKITGSVLKQARQSAMALTNETFKEKDNLNSDINVSEVFAYIYKSDGNIYGDVYLTEHKEIEKADHTKEIQVTYNKILSEKLCNDKITLVFSNHTYSTQYVVNEHDGYGVKVYFKKSTGAIAGIYISEGYDGTNESFNYAGGEMLDTIKLYGTSETKSLIIVPVTGRVYMDSTSTTSTPTPTGEPGIPDAPDEESSPEI